MRLPRPLDAVETRVLGCLLEKQQTTPEYYPMTLNALLAACNQRSNREPVMELTAADVHSALDRLRTDVLVWSSLGARVERWEHNLDRRWAFDGPTKAIMTELLLRGEQTPGELRSRSERMCAATSLAGVEAALHRLAEGPEPFVRELSRRPGQKETRWVHLAGGPEPDAASARVAPAASSVREEAPAGARGAAPDAAAVSLADRLARLEEAVGHLAQQLADLRGRLESG